MSNKTLVPPAILWSDDYVILTVKYLRGELRRTEKLLEQGALFSKNTIVNKRENYFKHFYRRSSVANYRICYYWFQRNESSFINPKTEEEHFLKFLQQELSSMNPIRDDMIEKLVYDESYHKISEFLKDLKYYKNVY